MEGSQGTASMIVPVAETRIERDESVIASRAIVCILEHRNEAAGT